jgi:sugar-specific transcriptional regulator TrmB
MDFIDSAPTKLSQRLIELTVAYDSKFGSIGCEIPRRCMHLAGYTENIEAILDHLSEKLDSIDKELVEYILINPSVDDYESIKSYVDNNTSLGITEARTTPKEYVQSLDLNEGDICVDYDASTPVLVQFSPGFRSSKFDEYILDRFTNMCMLMDSRKKGEDDE